MTEYELWSLILTAVGVVGGLAVAIAAFLQLKRMAEAGLIAVSANRMAALANVLGIENNIYERRYRVTEMLAALAELAERGRSGEDVHEAILARRSMLDEAIESYLNAVDRLCASILRGLIPEEEYRRDYRTLVNEIMTQEVYKPFFRPGTPHRNITKLFDKWADD